MSKELKPCPFCGGEATYGFDDMDKVAATQYWIVCDNNKCILFYLDCSYESEEEAIKAWNARPEPDKRLVEALEKIIKYREVFYRNPPYPNSIEIDKIAEIAEQALKEAKDGGLDI